MAVLLSQTPVEVLTVPSAAARISQSPVEVLTVPSSTARASQIAVEVLWQVPPPLGGMLSAAVLEVLWIDPTRVLLSSVVAEVLVQPDSTARASQVALEALWTVVLALDAPLIPLTARADVFDLVGRPDGFDLVGR